MMQVKNGKGRMPRLLATGLAALLLAGCGADRDGGKATATASGDGAPAPAYFDWFEYTGRDAAFEAPVPDGSFRNPVLSGFHSDPAVTAANGKFYLVASTFTFFPGIPVFESEDLVHWKQVGNAIHRPEQLDFDGSFVFRASDEAEQERRLSVVLERKLAGMPAMRSRISGRVGVSDRAFRGPRG